MCELKKSNNITTRVRKYHSVHKVEGMRPLYYDGHKEKFHEEFCAIIVAKGLRRMDLLLAWAVIKNVNGFVKK